MIGKLKQVRGEESSSNRVATKKNGFGCVRQKKGENLLFDLLPSQSSWAKKWGDYPDRPYFATYPISEIGIWGIVLAHPFKGMFYTRAIFNP